MLRPVWRRQLSCLLCIAALFTACQRRERDDRKRPSARSTPDSNVLQLTFTYGSEKQKWIEAATQAFHDTNPKLANGKKIRVEAIPLGSGESIEELLEGRRQAHLTSPASLAFVKLGNAESRTRLGRDLIGPTENLVLSPVVIAMWKPMAEALGWGRKPIGWSDVLSMARREGGWAELGHPEWGHFKLGHTHPDYSNSGLIALLAEVYAGTGKVSGLTLQDVANPQVGEFVGAIEKSIVHYGSSTGFFGRKMFSEGPGYLSAAVLYENMVIESYLGTSAPQLPVVAVYPKEGTFWSDHPVGIVEREWVTDEHRQAARAYIDFLLARPQQERAMELGFRPAEASIPLAAPLDSEHGIDPKEPRTTLEVPGAEVMHAVTQLWRAHKKHAYVVLALDVSGSMKDEDKIVHARAGAAAFLDQLADEDKVGLLVFSDELRWVAQEVELGTGRAQLKGQVENLFAEGGTALYDAVAAAYGQVAETPSRDRIDAVVVLSDGADRDSKIGLDSLLERIGTGGESSTVRVFTIGYGSDARAEVLQRIADQTQAKFYEGKPANIREVFKDISTFF